ncbi:MAG: hypothetical protein ACK57R_12955 [Dolichospermum sp.]
MTGHTEILLPCSLFPVPCSLFPVPCSLFPVPCSLTQPKIHRIKPDSYINHNFIMCCQCRLTLENQTHI